MQRVADAAPGIVIAVLVGMATIAGSPLRMSYCDIADNDEGCDANSARMEWSLLTIQEVDSEGNLLPMYNDFSSVASSLAFSSAGTSNCWTDNAANECSVKVAYAAFNYTGESSWDGEAQNDLSQHTYDFAMIFNDTTLVEGSMADMGLDGANRVLSYKLLSWPFSSSADALRLTFRFGVPNTDLSDGVYVHQDGYRFVVDNNIQVDVPARCVTYGSKEAAVMLEHSFASGVYTVVVELPTASDIEYSVSMMLYPDSRRLQSGGSGSGSSTPTPTPTPTESPSATRRLTAPLTPVSDNDSSPAAVRMCVDGAETCSGDAPILELNLRRVHEIDWWGNLVWLNHDFVTSDYEFAFTDTVNSTCLNDSPAVCSVKVGEIVFPFCGFHSDCTDYGSAQHRTADVHDHFMKCNHSRLESGDIPNYWDYKTNQVLEYSFRNWLFGNIISHIHFVFDIGVRHNGSYVESTIQDTGYSKIVTFGDIAAVSIPGVLSYKGVYDTFRVDITRNGPVLTCSVDLPGMNEMVYRIDIASIQSGNTTSISTFGNNGSTGELGDETGVLSLQSSGNVTWTSSGTPIEATFCANAAYDCNVYIPKLEWRLLSMHESNASGRPDHLYHTFDAISDYQQLLWRTFPSNCSGYGACYMDNVEVVFSINADGEYGSATSLPAGPDDLVMEWNHTRSEFRMDSSLSQTNQQVAFGFRNWNFSDIANRLHFTFSIGATDWYGGNKSSYLLSLVEDDPAVNLLVFNDTFVMLFPGSQEGNNGTTVEFDKNTSNNRVIVQVSFPALEVLEYTIDIAPIERNGFDYPPPIRTASSPIAMSLCGNGEQKCNFDTGAIKFTFSSLQEVDALGNPVNMFLGFDDTLDYRFRFNGAVDTSCVGNESSICSVKAAKASFPDIGNGRYGNAQYGDGGDSDFVMELNYSRLESGAIPNYWSLDTNQQLLCTFRNWRFSDLSHRLRLTFTVEGNDYGRYHTHRSIQDTGYSKSVIYDNIAAVWIPRILSRNGVYAVLHVHCDETSGILTCSVDLPSMSTMTYRIDFASLMAFSGNSFTWSSAPASTSALPILSSSGSGSSSATPFVMEFCLNGASECAASSPKLEWTLISLHEVNPSGSSVDLSHRFDLSTDYRLYFDKNASSNCTGHGECQTDIAEAAFPNNGDGTYGSATYLPAETGDLIMGWNRTRTENGSIDSAIYGANQAMTFSFRNWNFSDSANRLEFAFSLSIPTINGGYKDSYILNLVDGESTAKLLFFGDTASIVFTGPRSGDNDTMVQLYKSSNENVIIVHVIFPAFDSLEYSVGITNSSGIPFISAVQMSLCIDPDSSGNCLPHDPMLQWSLVSLQGLDSSGDTVNPVLDFAEIDESMLDFGNAKMSECYKDMYNPPPNCSVMSASAGYSIDEHGSYKSKYDYSAYPKYLTVEVNHTKILSGSVVHQYMGIAPPVVWPIKHVLSYRFRNWRYNTECTAVRFTFSFSLLDVDGVTSTLRVTPDYDGASFVVGGSADIYVPKYTDGSSRSVAQVSYTVSDDIATIQVDLDQSSDLQYSVTIGPADNEPDTSVVEVDIGEPSSAVDFFSGGFDFCVAHDCSIDDGMLDIALDRLGISPSMSTVRPDLLNFENLLTDFTQASGLNFDNVNEENAQHRLALAFPGSGGLAQSFDGNASRDSDTISVTLEVVRLTKTTTLPIIGTVVTAPAGSVHVRLTGIAPRNSLPRNKRIGVSFLLLAVQGMHIVSVRYPDSNDLYTGRLEFGDMYLSFPRYAEIDGYIGLSHVNVIVQQYPSGGNKGLIELLFDLPPFRQNISFEFFIGANNIQYGGLSNSSNSSSADSIASILELGDTDSPTMAPDGKPVMTKLLAFPRGAFGLAFVSENGTITSALKVAFTGLEATEGIKLGRFAEAAAFAFSDPQSVTQDNNEIWRVSFSALVPQSRTRPPIPNDSNMAGIHPAFSVTVDQYITPGYTYNANQRIVVPRGGLKFSFSISNWHFMSATDRIILNATLSSIVGDVPCASGLNWTDRSHVLRVWLNGDQFIDIPQLALYDGEVRPVQITPILEEGVGLVLSMAFSHFDKVVQYDPVVASNSLVAQDLKLLRTQRRKHLSRTVGIALLVILTIMIAVSVVRCLKMLPFKPIDFSKIIP